MKERRIILLSAAHITVVPLADLFMFWDRFRKLCLLKANPLIIFPDPFIRNLFWVLLCVFNLHMIFFFSSYHSTKKKSFKQPFLKIFLARKAMDEKFVHNDGRKYIFKKKNGFWGPLLLDFKKRSIKKIYIHFLICFPWHFLFLFRKFFLYLHDGNHKDSH